MSLFGDAQCLFPVVLCLDPGSSGALFVAGSGSALFVAVSSGAVCFWCQVVHCLLQGLVVQFVAGSSGA